VAGGDSLTVLDLSENGITDDGLTLLAGVLEVDGEDASHQHSTSTIATAINSDKIAAAVATNELCIDDWLPSPASVIIMCVNRVLTSNSILSCRPELPLETAGPQLQ
jgi:hypothetical protein